MAGKSSGGAARDRRIVAQSKQERNRHKRLMRACGLFLALLLAFAVGFVVRSQPAFVSSLGFIVDESEKGIVAASDPKSTYDSVAARVNEVEDLLLQSSMTGYELTHATDSMLDAIMKSTGDPYAAYFNIDRYASYIRESTSDTYAGIGVLFSEYNGRAYVSDVFEGSEAEAKGVVQGDFVTAVDGDAGIVWSMTDVLKALDREDGDTVVVTWMHPVSLDAETGTEYTTTLTYQKFEVENVTSALDEEVGYIRIRQFTHNSADLVRRAVQSLTAQGATAFVLDVRDNAGGYLTQAVDIASLFIPSGVVVEVMTSEGVTTKTASGVTVTEAPVVVIANGYTSAAAEVLVAALQDGERAEFVGTKTLGKGSVQVVRELTFGGAVRYTAAYYLTPLGREIDGIGVSPDVTVADADAQYRIAVETARALV